MTIEGIEVLKCEAFHYLGFIIQINGEFKNVDHKN